MKALLVLSFLLGVPAYANGIVSGEAIAAKIATAIGKGTVTCTAAGGTVTLNVDAKGVLRMRTGDLDTDNEGGGEECGGLTLKASAKYSTYLLDDSYDDCERGDWGYRIAIPQNSLSAIEKGDSFTARGWAQNDGTKDGAFHEYTCTTTK